MYPKAMHASMASAGIQVPSLDDDEIGDEIQYEPTRGSTKQLSPQLLAQCVAAGSFLTMIRLKFYLKNVIKYYCG